MDKRWFLTFGVLLITGLYMLIGTEQQQSRFSIWLDRHSSEETAEANALRPLIKCTNLADVAWRLDQAAPGDSLHDDFPHLQRYDPGSIWRDLCKPAIAFKASLLPQTQTLVPVSNRYTSSFESVLIFHQFVQSRNPGQAMLAFSFKDKLYSDRAGEFLSASQALRSELESSDLALRPRQLTQLEQKLGRDMHWHLLNYMLQARLTINRLDTAAQNRQLDLPLLGSATDGLRQVRDAAQAYRNALPANRRNGPAHELWSIVEPPAQQYQAALEQLATDWRNRAAPQVLSDDYWNVGHRYDVLLALYNRQADVDF